MQLHLASLQIFKCIISKITVTALLEYLHLHSEPVGNISILPLERNTMMYNTEYHSYFENKQYHVHSIIALLHNLEKLNN